MLYLELPKYFNIGFPQGLSRISKVLLAGIPRGFIQDVRGYRVLRFPRIFKVLLYMISKVLVRDFRGVSEVFLGLEGGEEDDKRGSGTTTTEQQKSSLNYVFLFFIFGYGP